jgi:glycosyltransferase involved in cell wall biosynthesis
MNNGKPRVSIGVPVYNGDKYIEEVLDSLLTQTFEDFELIVSDNASTDRTPEICQAYAARDSRIRYYRHEENRGAAWNFNHVVELAQGEYFKWAAADDICAPSLIAKCVEILDGDKSVILCYSKTRVIAEDGSSIYPTPSYLSQTNSPQPQRRFRNVLLDGIWCFEVFGLIRTDVLRKTPLIGKYYGSDKVLLAYLSLLGQFREISEELFFRRSHPDQSTNLTVREKAAWIAPQVTKRIPFQIEALMGYVSAIWQAPITMSQSVQCYFALLRLLLKLDKWKKLLLPGQYNYFGIGGSKFGRKSA